LIGFGFHVTISFHEFSKKTVIMAMVALPTWFQLEAIVRGATVIDVIILNTEVNIQKKSSVVIPFHY
jgi:hypothetical protein